MKVKSIVEKTKEFERLGGMIANIEKAIDAIKNPENIEQTYTFNHLSIFVLRDETPKNIELNSDVVEYINADLLVLLEGKLKELKKEQDDLEV